MYNKDTKTAKTYQEIIIKKHCQTVQDHKHFIQNLTELRNFSLLNNELFRRTISVKTRRPTHINRSLKLCVQSSSFDICWRKRQFDDAQQSASGFVASGGTHSAGIATHVGRTNLLNFQSSIFQDSDTLGVGRLNFSGQIHNVSD